MEIIFRHRRAACNTGFASGGLMCKWSFVLLFKFSAGRQFSAPKPASSPSAKTLPISLTKRIKNKT